MNFLSYSFSIWFWRVCYASGSGKYYPVELPSRGCELPKGATRWIREVTRWLKGYKRNPVQEFYVSCRITFAYLFFFSVKSWILLPFQVCKSVSSLFGFVLNKQPNIVFTYHQCWSGTTPGSHGTPKRSWCWSSPSPNLFLLFAWGTTSKFTVTTCSTCHHMK